jgi:hypothetical protein
MSRWLPAAVAVLAIALGAAILTGSILTSDSVTASIQNTAAQRAGHAAYVVSSRTFFREQLADEVARAGGWHTCPIIAVDGATPSARWVMVYGVDERFWKFHGKSVPAPGRPLTLRIDKPSPVPADTLLGPKSEEPVYLTAPVVEDPFSLTEGPQDIPSVFVPYESLQAALNQPGRANTILLSARTRANEAASIAEAVRERSEPEDIGVRFSDPEDGGTVVTSDSIVMPDTVVAAITTAAERLQVPISLTSSYKVQAIRAGDRVISDPEVAAADLPIEPNSIDLDAASARELRVKPGDQVTLEYQTWQDGHFNLATTIRWFQAPSNGTLISLTDGQRLWGTRFGSITSIDATLRSPEIRGEDGLASFRIAVQKAINPFHLGLSIRDLRPSSGAETDLLPNLLICSLLPVIAAFLLAGRGHLILPFAGTVIGLAAAPLYAKLLMHWLGITTSDFRPLSFLWGGLFALGLGSFCMLLTTGRRVRFVMAALAIVAVVSAQAFRARPVTADGIVAESRAPVIWNPGAPEGAKALNLPTGVLYSAFRVRPGGDASVRNPLKPKIPAILGAPASFLKGNPGQDVIPAVADAASHFQLRDEIVIDRMGYKPVRIRITGTLKNSPLQSYVIISETDFLKAFPEVEGYRLFLAQGAPAAGMNTALAHYGLNAEPVATRLARYKGVEETWISLFQMLGTLAVVLFGISTIPLRADK